MKLLTIFIALLFVLAPAAIGQNASPSAADSTTPAAAPATSAGPTTVYTLPPDKFEKAKALYNIHVRLRIIGTIWSLVVLLGLLYLGVVARYRDWAERLVKNSFVQAMIVVPLFLLTTTLFDVPLDAFSQHVSREYGLSVQGWGSWFGDLGKEFLVEAVVATILLWLMIWIIRRFPRRWWIIFWFPAYAIFLLVAYGEPWVVDPLFNKFEPLEEHNAQLVSQIEKLSARSGLEIPRSRMFLMKASEKTTELNAYVTGFGASKRIVVWDTTIEKTPPPEILFVVGHEMGHYVLNHVIYGLVLGAVGLFAGLYIIYLVSGWMLRRFGARWQIRELGDWAALPMIFLILSVAGFFAEPIANTASRRMEHNADIYGLEVTHGVNPDSQEAGAHAFQVLGEISLVYPYPNRLLSFWYGSHPTIADRVRFAHNYDPWSKGEPPKYVK